MIGNNMVELPEKVQEILKDFISKVKENKEIKQVLLYGSYAQNRWTSESDIDIAVFIEDNHSEHIRQMYKKLYILCYDYPLDVQIQVFSESELLKPMGIIEEVVSHGIDITTLV